MKLGKVVLIVVSLAALMIPLVPGIDFIGDINYIPGRGGTVNFAQNFTATQLNAWGSMWRWANMVWPGLNVGTFAIDASTGSTILVTGMTGDTITYTVTGAGGHSQWIYYRGRRSNMAIVTGGNVVPVTQTTLRVNTNGNSIVTINYVSVVPTASLSMDVLLSTFPLIALVVALEAHKRGLIDNNLMVMAVVIAIVGIMIYMFRVAGF